MIRTGLHRGFGRSNTGTYLLVRSEAAKTRAAARSPTKIVLLCVEESPSYERLRLRCGCDVSASSRLHIPPERAVEILRPLPIAMLVTARREILGAGIAAVGRALVPAARLGLVLRRAAPQEILGAGRDLRFDMTVPGRATEPRRRVGKGLRHDCSAFVQEPERELGLRVIPFRRLAEPVERLGRRAGCLGAEDHHREVVLPEPLATPRARLVRARRRSEIAALVGAPTGVLGARLKRDEHR